MDRQKSKQTFGHEKKRLFKNLKMKPHENERLVIGIIYVVIIIM